MGNSTSYDMNDKGHCERGDQHAENHLVPLTTGKEFQICHGDGSTSFGAGVGDGLGWRMRGSIQETIRILASDVSQNLSSPTREVVVEEFDIQRVFHVGDNEDDIGRGSIHGLGWC